MRTVTRTYRYTAILREKTHANLEYCLELQRQLWNACLAERENWYELYGNDTHTLMAWKNEQYRWLSTLCKRNPEGYGRFHVHAQRTAIARLDKAFARFLFPDKSGKKHRRPRFKKASDKMDSIELSFGKATKSNGEIALRPTITSNGGKTHQFKLKGIGQVRFSVKGGLPTGNYKMLRLVKNARRVEVHIMVEEPLAINVDERDFIGIDPGVKTRLTIFDGVNRHEVEKTMPNRTRLKKLQRKASKSREEWKKRGGEKPNNLIRKERAYASEARHIKERERGILHQETTKIVRDYSANIGMEDSSSKNLSAHKGNRFRGSNRALLDQAWGAAKSQMKYKAEAAGGQYIEVPAANTTKTCSNCGALKDMDLNDRIYECGECGHVDGRDVNSAENIRRLAVEIAQSRSGGIAEHGANVQSETRA